MKNIKIAIIGAGVAGHFTAAAIARNCKHAEITIYHDPNTPPIGVGESMAWGAPDFMRETLGLKNEFEWMRLSQSTYKFGSIQQGFTNQNDYPFYVSYPFVGSSKLLLKSPLEGYTGLIVNNDDNSLYDVWLHLYKKELRTKLDSRGDMSESHWFAFNNTCPVNENGEFLTLGSLGHSYHVDSNIIGSVINDLVGKPHGVKEVISSVKKININEKGIKSITLNNNSEIVADLFIDCTGFKRLLMKELDAKFIPCDESFNNSAIVGIKYYESEKDYTNITSLKAMPNGWAFKIPTHNRTGNGYIFNNRLTNSEEHLIHEFEQITGNKDTIKRRIKWEPGYYEKCMVKNCISIGLSYGFTEAFDANSLSATLVYIKRLIKHLNEDISGTQEWRNDFNYYTNAIADDIIFRIQCAMHLAPRNDTNYWNEMKIAGKKFKTLEKLLDNIYSDDRKKYLGYQNKLYSQHIFINTVLYYDIPFSIPSWNIHKQTEELALNWFKFFNNRNKIIAETSMNIGKFYKNTIYKDIKFN